MGLTNKQKSFIEKNRHKKSAAEIAELFDVEEKEIRDYIKNIPEPISGKKKILFYTITFSIPILFFILLEAGLRIGNYMGNTDLFIEEELKGKEYKLPNPNFAARYFFYTKTIPSPSSDAFLKVKPENGLRIFAMGGSSAAAYPYGFNGTFSRVVDDVLEDALPDKEIEVINTGISAINSYTLFDQVDEILQEEPDAVMIYAGHNEFYGALGVGSNENLGAFPGFVRFYLNLQRFKTFMLIRNVIVESGKWFAVTFGNPEDMADPSATLMERIVASRSIEYNGEIYKLAMNQFRSNLTALLDAFAEQDIPVFLSTIASNVQDHPPFVSIEKGNERPAGTVYKEARQAFSDGDTLKASALFERAKDLDGLKFRAPAEINEIIIEIAGSYPNTILVDAHGDLQARTNDGIIGNELMLEHLHPNQDGYFSIGASFADQILDYLGILSYPNGYNTLEPYKDQMNLSYYDHRYAWHSITALKQGFPFVQTGSVEPYQKTYEPINYVDSLAFESVHNDLRWDRAKVQIAEYYENQKEYDKAVLEYLALARQQPWNDSPYIFAARLLLDQNRFEEAEPLLREAYNLQPEEAFTTKMLGAIELNKGNTEEAIRFLEASMALNANDPQMLYNLSGAYGVDQQFEKALDIAYRVEKINPNFPGLQAWKNQLINIINQKRNRQENN